MQHVRHSNSGFTLVEVIVTLIVASILGTILVQVMGVNFSKSAAHLIYTREGFEIKKEVESLTKDYKKWLVDFPEQSIVDFKTGTIDTYSGSLNVSGVLSEIDTGNDGDIGILRVVVADNHNRSLTTFFTK